MVNTSYAGLGDTEEELAPPRGQCPEDEIKHRYGTARKSGPCIGSALAISLLSSSATLRRKGASK